MQANLPEMSEVEYETIRCISESKKQEGQCARNSILHLEKAYKIKEIDPEMSYFRAITAEEEAASALMYLLRSKKYVNSEKLDPQRHVHKNAIMFYLYAINNYIAEKKKLPFKMQVIIRKKEKSSKRIGLRISVPIIGFMESIPPLEININDYYSGQPLVFNSNMEKALLDLGENNIIDNLKEAANIRNRILYASEKGVVRIDGKLKEAIEFRRRNVFILLLAFCMIFPYKKKQKLVQQILDGIVIVLNRIEIKTYVSI